MVMPSITLCGSLSRIERSMNAPGSPSSALQMTYLGSPGERRQSSHFVPVENPAPPRPRNWRRFHFADHVVRRHLAQHLGQRRVPVAGDVGLDLLGVDQAAVAQRDADLLAEQRRVLESGSARNASGSSYTSRGTIRPWISVCSTISGTSSGWTRQYNTPGGWTMAIGPTEQKPRQGDGPSRTLRPNWRRFSSTSNARNTRWQRAEVQCSPPHTVTLPPMASEGFVECCSMLSRFRHKSSRSRENSEFSRIRLRNSPNAASLRLAATKSFNGKPKAPASDGKPHFTRMPRSLRLG
jgi:hypothetical protein